MGRVITPAMVEAGLAVLEESGLVEGSWNWMPSSAGLTVAEIYAAMEAKLAEDDKGEPGSLLDELWPGESDGAPKDGE